MALSRLDLSAPLLPTIGVGPIKLGENVFLVRQLMLEELDVIELGANKQGDWEGMYVFSDWNKFSYQDALHIYSSVFTGEIVEIVVTGAYTGTVHGIGIGSCVAEILQTFATVEFDDELVLVTALGVHFEIDAPADFNSLREVAHHKVVSISLRTPGWQNLPLGASSLERN